MIRDEDQVRELWQQAIPDQYRISDKTPRRDRLGRPIHSEASAIIPPPPPSPSKRHHLRKHRVKPLVSAEGMAEGMSEREYQENMAEIFAALFRLKRTTAC